MLNSLLFQQVRCVKDNQHPLLRSRFDALYGDGDFQYQNPLCIGATAALESMRKQILKSVRMDNRSVAAMRMASRAVDAIPQKIRQQLTAKSAFQERLEMAMHSQRHRLDVMRQVAEDLAELTICEMW